jgi:hypothetical protein
MIKRRMAIVLVVGIAITVFHESQTLAKVRLMSLSEFVEAADFIGVVRVEQVSGGIPFLKRRRATATVIDSWKGQATGTVTFRAAPTWTCDISDAKKGEEAIVFIRRGELELSGRGRMPIFTREGRRLAAVWPDVRLPPGLVTEAGPEPQYDFIRSVAVDAIRDEITTLLSRVAEGRP